MKFEEIHNRITKVREDSKDMGDMKDWRGEFIYQLIRENSFKKCLELGTGQGQGTCYIAAAIEENGGEYVDTVDLEESLEYPINISDLSKKVELDKYINPHIEKTSYTWFLKKQIEKYTSLNNCKPIYDLCYIDGAKNWDYDGFSFFLVDKLLNKGGYVIFDDMYWKYSDFIKKKNLDYMHTVNIKNFDEDQINTPHINAVYTNLVLQHPNYGNFVIYNNWWGIAQKIRQSPRQRDIKVSRL